MHPDGQEIPAGGVCHARGPNTKLPPVWLVYIKVPSVEQAAAKALASGGKVMDGPKKGESWFAVLKDPAEAAFAFMD